MFCLYIKKDYYIQCDNWITVIVNKVDLGIPWRSMCGMLKRDNMQDSFQQPESAAISIYKNYDCTSMHIYSSVRSL